MLAKLKSADKKLYEFIHEKITFIIPTLDNISSFFKEYTDHSSKHSEKILKIADRLNVNNELNKYELAVFILAAYFHDKGMFASADEFNDILLKIKTQPEYNYLKNQILTDDKLQDQDEIEYFLVLDYIRSNHAKRSSIHILDNFPEGDPDSYFEREFYIWHCVATVCESHTLDHDDLKLPAYNPKTPIGDFEFIDVVYLSILLRLSDICHFSKDRALPYFRNTKGFLSKKSESIWKYYADIVDTCPNIETNTIDIFATCKDYYNHRSIIKQAGKIQEELINSHKILIDCNSKYFLPWKFVNTKNVNPHPTSNYQYLETRFKLNYKKITNLLMGNRLYRDDLFAVRECIQNALDSIFVAQKKLKSMDNYILIDYSKPVTGQILLDIYDTGTGMDKEIINKYFLSIGEESFWFTKRCINEWGDFKKHDGLIADHGIGALSYFMLANKIEIFSIYHVNGTHNHVYIDNYENDIIFLNTAIKGFPKFDETIGLSNPWELRHGTCIRLHLDKNIPLYSLLNFLSKHIVRIHTKIVLNYWGSYIGLSDIWHFRVDIDNHCYQKTKYFYHLNADFPKGENNSSIEEQYKKLYIEPKGYYENPPHDNSISNNYFEITNKSLRVKININYENTSTACRISQNGILIENAIDYISSKHGKGSIFLSAYGFDIDVTSEFQFQLDAERTRILNNEYNLNIFKKIIQIMDSYYFELISKIGSSLYFPCGGVFYHGMGDILFPHPNLKIYFHKNLKENFPIQDIDTISNKYNLENFNLSKIYAVGYTRSCPISVNDIKSKPLLRRLLILKEQLTKKPIKRYGRDYEEIRNEDVNGLLNKVKNIPDCNSLVYLPLNNEAFVLPLVINFDFTIAHEDKNFCVINILDKGKQSIEEKIKILEI